MEAGLDSLGAVELRNALGSRFNLPDLPATLTYDYTTIKVLADHIGGTAQSLASLALDSFRYHLLHRI